MYDIIQIYKRLLLFTVFNLTSLIDYYKNNNHKLKMLINSFVFITIQTD